jgi:hypothetical protein
LFKYNKFKIDVALEEEEEEVNRRWDDGAN